MLGFLVAAAVMVAAYFVYTKYISKKDDAPVSTPSELSNTWTVLYSAGTPASFTDSVDIPQQPGSIHYVIKAPPPVTLGQTVSLTFTVEGDGEWKPTEGDPPARVRLFLWRKGDNLTGQGEYEFYRFWSSDSVSINSAGTYTFTEVLDPAKWTAVYGKGDVNGFNGCLSNLYGVGFTFGGMFAGHGVYSSGPSKFTVKDYTIG